MLNKKNILRNYKFSSKGNELRKLYRSSWFQTAHLLHSKLNSTDLYF